MGFKSFCFLAILILAATLSGGCSNEVTTDCCCTLPQPAPALMPFPHTEDQLMSNFHAVYEDMDYANYQNMLHPDFVTFLQSSTQLAFPGAGPTLDLAEELRIASRLFSGQPVTDGDGALVPAISDISFDVFEQQGEWQTALPSDPVPDARFALFNVVILADRPGTSTVKISGQIKFYATGHDSVVSGATKTYWQLLAQQDSTNSAAKQVEEMNWGSFKALYY